jgi:1-acyl-sn-glycerol-3-phosphate acyltransferase
VQATANSRAFLRLLYGVYAWIILLFVVVPVTTGLLLVPGLERRRAIARWGAAAVLAMIGSPVRVSGAPARPVDHAVVVANHSSYLDGIILTAVLPPQYTFLIKHEMTSVPVAGFVLRRLGSEFVDRANASTRQRSARRLVEAARAGAALAVFPEGTFDLAPGLRAFHMGAFRAAWRVGLTVVPVVIRGARAKLPGEERLPRPGPLTVEFCPPLNPADFGDETALMRAARTAMLARLGEPDLDPPPQSPE